MKVYVYKGGLCDPVRGIGTCRQFTHSDDVDAYVRLFCASLDPKHLRNWGVYITNDEVEFHEVDHFVLMDEPYGLAIGASKIKTVNIFDVMKECNKTVIALEKIRSNRQAKADSSVKEVKTDESAREVAKDLFRK